MLLERWHFVTFLHPAPLLTHRHSSYQITNLNGMTGEAFLNPSRMADPSQDAHMTFFLTHYIPPKVRQMPRFIVFSDLHHSTCTECL